MSTIVTREVGATAKGSPLTNAELDTNFVNLNDGKLEKENGTSSGYLNVEGTLSHSFTLGDTVSSGTLGFISSDGTVKLADASIETTLLGQLVIAPASGASGETQVMALWGVISGLSGLTPGQPCYVSETAGAITQTQPATFVRIIGFALSSTSLFLNPSQDWIEL